MSDLFTIGYESTELQLFIDCLKENCITVLIDVRDLPISRKRGFSKKSLSEALAQAGINYEHWRQLGAPREIRHELRQTKNWDKYARAYSQVLDVQKSALVDLAVRTNSDRLCLMCFERDYKECHRSLVAERLEQTTLTNGTIHLIPKTTHLAAAA